MCHHTSLRFPSFRPVSHNPSRHMCARHLTKYDQRHSCTRKSQWCWRNDAGRSDLIGCIHRCPDRPADHCSEGSLGCSHSGSCLWCWHSAVGRNAGWLNTHSCHHRSCLLDCTSVQMSTDTCKNLQCSRIDLKHEEMVLIALAKHAESYVDVALCIVIGTQCVQKAM